MWEGLSDDSMSGSDTGESGSDTEPSMSGRDRSRSPSRPPPAKKRVVEPAAEESMEEVSEKEAKAFGASSPRRKRLVKYFKDKYDNQPNPEEELHLQQLWSNLKGKGEKARNEVEEELGRMVDFYDEEEAILEGKAAEAAAGVPKDLEVRKQMMRTEACWCISLNVVDSHDVRARARSYQQGQDGWSGRIVQRAQHGDFPPAWVHITARDNAIVNGNCADSWGDEPVRDLNVLYGPNHDAFDYLAGACVSLKNIIWQLGKARFPTVWTDPISLAQFTQQWETVFPTGASSVSNGKYIVINPMFLANNPLAMGNAQRESWKDAGRVRPKSVTQAAGTVELGGNTNLLNNILAALPCTNRLTPDDDAKTRCNNPGECCRQWELGEVHIHRDGWAGKDDNTAKMSRFELTIKVHEIPCYVDSYVQPSIDTSDYQSWTPVEVSDWLTSKNPGFGKYGDVFKENEVDGVFLEDAIRDAETMKDFGVDESDAEQMRQHVRSLREGQPAAIALKRPIQDKIEEWRDREKQAREALHANPNDEHLRAALDAVLLKVEGLVRMKASPYTRRKYAPYRLMGGRVRHRRSQRKRGRKKGHKRTRHIRAKKQTKRRGRRRTGVKGTSSMKKRHGRSGDRTRRKA